MGNTTSLEQYLIATERIQPGPSGLLLRAGRNFKGAPLSPHIPRGTRGACFRNAAMLAIANPSMRYVEGVAWSTIPAPIAHAWCIDESGRVVDATWPYEASAEYFGVAFKTSFLRAYIYEMASFSVLDDPRFWRRAWDAVKKEPLPYWFEALAPFESESVPETTDDQ